MRHIVLVLMSLRIINCLWGKAKFTKTTSVDVVFIPNPIEAEMPGHWLPADILKKILEMRGNYTSTLKFKLKPTNKVPVTIKKSRLKYIPNPIRETFKPRTTTTKMNQNTNRPTAYTAKPTTYMNKKPSIHLPSVNVNINNGKTTTTISTHTYSHESASQFKHSVNDDTDSFVDVIKIHKKKLKKSENLIMEASVRSTTSERSSTISDTAIKNLEEVTTLKIINIDTTKTYTTQSLSNIHSPSTTNSPSISKTLSTTHPSSTTELLSITQSPITAQTPSSTHSTSTTKSPSTTQQTTTTATSKPTTTILTTTTSTTTTPTTTTSTTTEADDSGNPFY